MNIDSWGWRAGLAMLAGCTAGAERAGGGALDDLGSAAAPAMAPPPDVISIPLDLWFNPLGLELGDFDGDGAIDLLVSGVEPGVGVTAGVFRGDGDGQFAPAIDTGFTACSAFPVTGDLNGDGRTDVVALGCDDDLAVFVGQPDGTLEPWSAWPDVEYTPVSASAIVDFEGDGDRDLVTLRVPDAAYIDVALGNGGDGIWKVERSEIGRPSWSSFDPGGMALGHFDDDGILDAALIEREHDVMRVLGDRSARFVLPLELGVSTAPWSTRVADLDRDGFDDLVVSSYNQSEIVVMVSDGRGEFTTGGTPSTAGFRPYDTALGDTTGDGVVDVAIVDDTQAQVQVITGLGNGRLGSTRAFALPSPAVRVHAARLDGDKVDDLVTATFADGSLTLVLSDT